MCKFGTIASLCSLLKAEEDEIVLVALDGLANILAAAKRIAQLEKVTLHVEECGGLNRLEDFLNHHNVEIYHKSLAIVEQYFSMNDYVIISSFILFFFKFMSMINTTVHIQSVCVDNLTIYEIHNFP